MRPTRASQGETREGHRRWTRCTASSASPASAITSTASRPVNQRRWVRSKMPSGCCGVVRLLTGPLRAWCTTWRTDQPWVERMRKRPCRRTSSYPAVHSMRPQVLIPGSQNTTADSRWAR